MYSQEMQPQEDHEDLASYLRSNRQQSCTSLH